ncbi:MAG: NAD(P)/FAD-dependent oxidoreductase [Lachnospiraceae bacterium]|nr:NAD(P)/FAD-dependent oxidoreductase [Lachnospiraceae bacterium]
MKKKVVIIGAGPAGITAGYELMRQSSEYEVIILEQSDVIGGISRTVNHNGNRMDIGGHRFFSKSNEVMEWWNHIMPLQGAPAYDDKILHRQVPLQENGPDPETQNRVMLFRNRLSRIYYRKKFFDYPVKMNWNTIKNMGFLTTIRAMGDYLLSVLHKKPETSLENFYLNRFGRTLYALFFEGYTQKVWGRHPKDISADWGAQRAKGLSVMAIVKDNLKKLFGYKKKEVETSLIEEFLYPKYGPGQLWECAAADFEKMGGTIKKNCQVNGMITKQNKVVAITYHEAGDQKQLEADYVISSMPLKDLVAGMNSVPEELAQIARGLPYRDFVTVGVLVKKLKLQNKTKWKTLNNIIPDCWIYVQNPEIMLGRIQIFNNWSPYMVQKPEENIWIGLEYFCNEGDAYWCKSKEEWMSFARQELEKMDILAEETPILDYHVEKVLKAYPAYFDTYKEIDQLIAWLNMYSNLFCVGRNGQHRYNNMDHSMITAFLAVEHILQKRTDKSDIWRVNTEKEYHEEKRG